MTDRSTRAVFGEHISIYDIERAVKDGATVPIYYEGRLAKIDIHYVRKENQLFPFLEKHDISGPSQVMWGIHDEIRAMIKDVSEAVGQDDAAKVAEKAPALSRAVIEMIYKENTILFPMALDALSEDEWIEIQSLEPWKRCERQVAREIIALDICNHLNIST